MALPPASFNQFATGPMQAVKLVENSVIWIPYGWVTMMVNNVGQLGFPQTLVIPYLNAKLALGYPGLGHLVNFHFDHVKANQGTLKYWSEHGDSYSEWLGTLNRHEDIQAIQDEFKEVCPLGQQALMDGHAEDEGHADQDTLPPDEDGEQQAVTMQDSQT